MLVLGALCVLLPLVTSLETCNSSIVECFRAKNQLPGNILAYLAEKHYWFVAVSSKGAGRIQTVEVKFESVIGNTVPTKFVYRDKQGNTSTVFGNYTLVDDHICTGANSVYFFQCSELLIGGYRCQDPGTRGGSGPKFFVWAAWNTLEFDIVIELERCRAKLKKFEADLDRRYHPYP